MAASEFVGLRLNYKKDKDILDAIGNAKNRTEEIKRLLRLGISVTQGHINITSTSVQPTTQQSKKIHQESKEPLDWRQSFADKEVVEDKPKANGIAANILSGFE